MPFGPSEKEERDETDKEREIVKCNSVSMAHLEPTRLHWENGQVSLTSLKTREASVQECNGVKSVHN